MSMMEVFMYSAIGAIPALCVIILIIMAFSKMNHRDGD